MKSISTVDAVGHVLCHDLTQIIPGEFKGATFKKGHVVTEEDIPVLLSMGKENLYVWEKIPGMIHEDEGARRLLELCENEHMHATALQFYYNAGLCKVGQSTAEYGGKPWNYYGLDC